MRLLLVVFLTLRLSIPGFSQAWIRQKGQHYLQVSHSFLRGKAVYSSDGSTRQLERPVIDNTFHAFAEMGITDKITLQVSTQAKSLRTKGVNSLANTGTNPTLPEGDLFKPGNSNMTALFGITQASQFVASCGLGIEIPSTLTNEAAGLRTGVNAFGFSPQVNLGSGFSSGFIQLSMSPKFRTNQYSTQLNCRLEGGITIEESWYIISDVTLLKSFYDGQIDDGNFIYTGLYVNNLEYLTYGLKFGKKFNENTYIWLSSAGGFWGNHVLKSPAFTIAIAHEIN